MVYLIHFNEKLKHAQHYIGFVDGDHNLEDRLIKHQSGNGSRIMHVVTGSGIQWKLARTWPGESRTFERKLKNRKNSKQLCPCCNKKLEHLMTK